MRFILTACSIFLLPLLANAAPQKLISDSLVDRLPCNGLNESNILQHLQPNAFSIDKHFPIENWSSGGGLAECWSLSHAQRISFFLARFGQADLTDPRDLGTIADIFRGRGDFQVFPAHNVISLYNSQVDFMDGFGHERRFQWDIQSYEDWRFYQPSNANLIFGERDRSQAENLNSFQQIQQDLSRGRMPLVILRGNLTTQHAVLIKRGYPLNSEEWQFDVYDSNFPTLEHHIIYNQDAQEFTAQDIVAPFHIDSTSPIGLFIEDESDMDAIQSTLLAYYQVRCQE